MTTASLSPTRNSQLGPLILACLAATAWLTYRQGRDLGLPAGVGAAAALLVLVEWRLLWAALSGMENVFFCNSGTEANEAAIKLVRFHDLIIAHEHQRDVDPEAAGACIADAYLKGYFELPNFVDARRARRDARLVPSRMIL